MESAAPIPLRVLPGGKTSREADDPVEPAPVVGVLALQGDFEAHAKILTRLGAIAREVRVPSDLQGIDALVIPGGESTVMTLGVEAEGVGAAPARAVLGAPVCPGGARRVMPRGTGREGLGDPLRSLAKAGTPILG